MNDLNRIQKNFNSLLINERKKYINYVLESFYEDLLKNGVCIDSATKEIETLKNIFFKNDLKS